MPNVVKKLGVSTQDFFNFIQGDPSLLAGVPALSRIAAWGGGFPVKVNGELVGTIGVSGAPKVQNDIDCALAALALVSDAAFLANPEAVFINGENLTVDGGRNA